MSPLFHFLASGCYSFRVKRYHYPVSGTASVWGATTTPQARKKAASGFEPARRLLLAARWNGYSIFRVLLLLSRRAFSLALYASMQLSLSTMAQER